MHILTSRFSAIFSLICGLAVCMVLPASAQDKAPNTAVSHATWSGTVTHVTDGDTLWVRPVSGGKPVRIRIDGVDAPEICQPHGIVAKKALTARLARQTVTVQSSSRDSFGRLLARVTVVPKVKGSADVGEWLVREGHAWSYRYRRDSGPYAKQQAMARAARKGLFATARPEEPREFRKRYGACN
jgi:micrococcal nuclease